MSVSVAVRVEWWVVQHLRGCFTRVASCAGVLTDVDTGDVDPVAVMNEVFAEGSNWGRYFVFAWWLCDQYGYKKGREHWAHCRLFGSMFADGSAERKEEA